MSKCPHCGKNTSVIKVGKKNLPVKYLVTANLCNYGAPEVTIEDVDKLMNKIPGIRNDSSSFGEYDDYTVHIEIAAIDKATANKAAAALTIAGVPPIQLDVWKVGPGYEDYRKGK